MSSPSSPTDPRDPKKIVNLSLASEDAFGGDLIQLVATGMTFCSHFFRKPTFAWGALVIAAMSIANRGPSFSWIQCFMTLAMATAQIVLAIKSEMSAGTALLEAPEVVPISE